MIRVRIRIHGNPVQGVFFRAYVLERAQDRRLIGWVANEVDGTVTVVVEGPKNQVTDLVDSCSSGPSRAQVEKVEAQEETYTGEFEEFAIRY
jgi:acylphosphatase